MSIPDTNPDPQADEDLVVESARDLAALSAHDILLPVIVDLMTAAAVKTGLYEGGEQHRDLADARILINALAGLVDGAAPSLGSQHAAPIRDGLRSLQLAFAEYLPHPDPAGDGPGEKYTGMVAR